MAASIRDAPCTVSECGGSTDRTVAANIVGRDVFRDWSRLYKGFRRLLRPALPLVQPLAMQLPPCLFCLYEVFFVFFSVKKEGKLYYILF